MVATSRETQALQPERIRKLKKKKKEKEVKFSCQ